MAHTISLTIIVLVDFITSIFNKESYSAKMTTYRKGMNKKAKPYKCHAD